jgi:hypothetical protein
MIDDAGLETIRLQGLTQGETALLLKGASPQAVARLHRVTAGNPLGLIELARDTDELELSLAPVDAPMVVSARIARSFRRRLGELDPAERRSLLLPPRSRRPGCGRMTAAPTRVQRRRSSVPPGWRRTESSVRGRCEMRRRRTGMPGSPPAPSR